MSKTGMHQTVGDKQTILVVDDDPDALRLFVRMLRACDDSREILTASTGMQAHDKVNLSAIVQKMVDSEKSGVMFSSQPSTGEPLVVIEGAWGLGESIVSGSVSPDTFVVDRKTKNIVSKYIATKEIMIIRDPATQKTVTVKVPAEKKDAVVLTDNEALELARYAAILEKHYGIPQDIEWGVEKGKIYILQSRPITTINMKKPAASAESSGKVLVSGLGAAPGDMLMSYHWPGNVRELENCVERAVLVCDSGAIHAHHLPPTLQTAEVSGTLARQSLKEALDAYEKDLVQDALKSARGNRAKAARLLHTTERILGYAVKKHGIDTDRFR